MTTRSVVANSTESRSTNRTVEADAAKSDAGGEGSRIIGDVPVGCNARGNRGLAPVAPAM